MRKSKLTKPEIPLETEEQADFVEHLESEKVRFFAVPNGTFTSSFTAKRKAKREGAKKGVPDIIILYDNGRHNILFVEMKRQKGGVLSEEQKEWIEWLDQKDYPVCVAKGSEHAKLLFEKYKRGEY